MPVNAAPDLSHAVQDLLRAEASRSEARIAVIRVIAYSLVGVIDLVLLAAGKRPLASVLTVLPWVAGSVVLWAVTRRHFRPWVPYAVPVVDAAVIAILVNTRMAMLGNQPSTLLTAAAASALFAATGGIRFERRQSLWTTALAIATLYATVGWRMDPLNTLYPLLGVASVGILARWQADLARRALEGERGKEVLKRFVHSDVVERAFSDPQGLMTAPREVEATMMMCDLRGFTAIAERLRPEEVLALLNDYQSELAAAVAHHGGVVDKFIGDGMFATFGAVRPLAAHATAAVRCAEDIIARIEQLNLRRAPNDPLRFGIGIHTGRVVVGTLGRGDRMEFTVLGDAVNTAARLESATKELGVPVLISETTAAASSGVPLFSRGSLSLRGRTRTVEVYVPEAAEHRALAG